MFRRRCELSLTGSVYSAEEARSIQHCSRILDDPKLAVTEQHRAEPVTATEGAAAACRVITSGEQKEDRAQQDAGVVHEAVHVTNVSVNVESAQLKSRAVRFRADVTERRQKRPRQKRPRQKRSGRGSLDEAPLLWTDWL